MSTWLTPGMWPRSRLLGFEAVSRPIKASVSSRLGRIGKRLGLGLGVGIEEMKTVGETEE